MSGFRAGMPTFAGGEIGPQIASRYDTAKYGSALERGRDVLGLPGGGVYNRPGLEWCAVTQDYTKLSIVVAFVFSTDQSYALEFSDQTMRVFSGGGPVIRPKLTIMAISNEPQAIVNVPDHGYEIGWDVTFEGVSGMVEINGLTGRVVNIAGDDIVVDIDTSSFGLFTADSGGIAGNANGGVGGYAPVDPDAPPPDIPYIPTTPPTRLPNELEITS